MEKLFLKFKDGRPQPNLLIEGVEIEKGFFHVEIWDVFTNYHSCSLFEEDKQRLLASYNEEIKTLKTRLTNDKAKDVYVKLEIDNIKSLISNLNKYKNKRFKYTEKEFNSTFEIISRLNL